MPLQSEEPSHPGQGRDKTEAKGPLAPAYNRDDQMKPSGEGGAPRPASEPRGQEGSARSAKTLTDPASGEPLPGAPAPAASKADEAET